jgi:hypothetical protein
MRNVEALPQPVAFAAAVIVTAVLGPGTSGRHVEAHFDLRKQTHLLEELYETVAGRTWDVCGGEGV